MARLEAKLQEFRQQGFKEKHASDLEDELDGKYFQL